MAANMHVTSNGYSLEAMKTGAGEATLYLTEPSGDTHDVDLTNAQYKGGIFTATAQVLFLRPAVVIQFADTELWVKVSHSGFADGDHSFPLNPTDMAQAKSFFQEFAT